MPKILVIEDLLLRISSTVKLNALRGVQAPVENLMQLFDLTYWISQILNASQQLALDVIFPINL